MRELRQQASDLVRRVESGEAITVTVSGRPAARLVPIEPRVWRPAAELAGLFAGPGDDDWVADRERLDDAPSDPFAR